MPRFVILRHDLPAQAGRATHWDLMLETGGVLATWALAELPEPGKELWAQRLADHRIDYLDYEGEVSGDRGRVTRWDAGHYELVTQTPLTWLVLVRGQRLAGRIALQAFTGDPSHWTIRFTASRQT